MLPTPLCSTFFPYTTLFRSVPETFWVQRMRRLLDSFGEFLDLAVAEAGAVGFGIENLQGLDVGFVVLDELTKGLRSEEHTSELQSLRHLVCRLLLDKKKIVI